MPINALRAFLRRWREQLHGAARTAFEDAVVTQTARASPTRSGPTDDPNLRTDVDSFLRVARSSGHAAPETVDALFSRIGRYGSPR